MSQQYNYSTTNGNQRTTITYNCSSSAFAYTIMGDDIKKDFDFLLEEGELGSLLNQFLDDLKTACDVENPFNFNDTHTDISKLYTEIQANVNDLKTSLVTLNSALKTDIDNVNAELKTNFGYWVGGKVNEAGRSTTTINP